MKVSVLKKWGVSLYKRSQWKGVALYFGEQSYARLLHIEWRDGEIIHPDLKVVSKSSGLLISEVVLRWVSTVITKVNPVRVEL